MSKDSKNAKAPQLSLSGKSLRGFTYIFQVVSRLEKMCIRDSLQTLLQTGSDTELHSAQTEMQPVPSHGNSMQLL